MGKNIKQYKDFIKENVVEPTTKPKTSPTQTPTRRKSPIRRDKPSVTPKPKATAADVANKFLDLTKNNKEIQTILKKKYNK